MGVARAQLTVNPTTILGVGGRKLLVRCERGAKVRV